MYMRCTKSEIIIMKILVFILLTLPFDARSIPLGGQVCQNMWNNAKNNLIIPGELAVNAGNNLDQVFTLVQGGGAQGDKKLQSEEFTRFHDILVDHQAQQNLNQQHIDDFITAITQPEGPVKAALDYLINVDNALPGVTTLEQFRCTLESLWFSNSDGFKQVFVGKEFQHKEPNEIRYRGFQNWYQYYIEERRPHNVIQKIQGLPTFVMNKRPNFMRDLKFIWRGRRKQGHSGSRMFVGTSPAFELALFTTCLLTGRGNAGGGFPPPGPYRTTDCECTINVPGIGLSTVEVRTVENQNGKVVTATPMNVH